MNVNWTSTDVVRIESQVVFPDSDLLERVTVVANDLMTFRYASAPVGASHGVGLVNQDRGRGRG
jgi:hypothetical protein